MADICGFEHLIGKAPKSASLLADSSDDEDSEVMDKLSMHSATETLTTNGCTPINRQSFHDDRCSDSSEEEDEGNIMMVTHKHADGHLKLDRSVPHHRWRSARALFSQLVQEMDMNESRRSLNQHTSESTLC